jgi:hypothetical protein
MKQAWSERYHQWDHGDCPQQMNVSAWVMGLDDRQLRQYERLHTFNLNKCLSEHHASSHQAEQIVV